MKQAILSFLQKKVGDKPVVIGLSGGIDSTLVAFLCVEAFGADRVRGVVMPSPTTAKQDIADGEEVAELLGIRSATLPIEPLMREYTHTTDVFENDLARANLQARIRMTLLYGHANAHGAMVIGTGNKSEMLTGYFTKYGDGGVDLLPIAHLYKIQVWELAREMGVPQKFIDKAPTAGLQPGQTDEDEIGMSYQDLDAILQAMENDTPLNEFDATQVARVQELVSTTEHKRMVPAQVADVMVSSSNHTSFDKLRMTGIL
jgi:NAD+ synthase